MKLVFTREADRHVETIDAWWRENRADAPDLFTRELSEICAEVLRHPSLIDSTYTIRSGRRVRRWLMPRTRNHLYFELDAANETIVVLAVWGARRGRGPRL
jgi:plasmid stabilization system protein ParE